jgi:hypothetical protein
MFNRLELENGRWVPRHWPPNLGASRDIPHGAEIHSSVFNLHRAGIIRDSQLPKTGGNNPHISALRASFAWSKTSARETAVDKQLNEAGTEPLHLIRLLSIPFSTSKAAERDVSLILSDGLANGTARL